MSSDIRVNVKVDIEAGDLFDNMQRRVDELKRELTSASAHLQHEVIEFTDGERSTGGCDVTQLDEYVAAISRRAHELSALRDVADFLAAQVRASVERAGDAS